MGFWVPIRGCLNFVSITLVSESAFLQGFEVVNIFCISRWKVRTKIIGKKEDAFTQGSRVKIVHCRHVDVLRIILRLGPYFKDKGVF